MEAKRDVNLSSIACCCCKIAARHVAKQSSAKRRVMFKLRVNDTKLVCLANNMATRATKAGSLRLSCLAHACKASMSSASATIPTAANFCLNSCSDIIAFSNSLSWAMTVRQRRMYLQRALPPLSQPSEPPRCSVVEELVSVTSISRASCNRAFGDTCPKATCSWSPSCREEALPPSA